MACLVFEGTETLFLPVPLPFLSLSAMWLLSSLLLSLCYKRSLAVILESQWTFLEGTCDTEFNFIRKFSTSDEPHRGWNRAAGELAFDQTPHSICRVWSMKVWEGRPITCCLAFPKGWNSFFQQPLSLAVLKPPVKLLHVFMRTWWCLSLLSAHSCRDQ